MNIVAVSETTKFFLTSGIPYIESDRSSVSVEYQGVHFDTQGGYVFLFELSSQVTFDKSSLSGTTVSYLNKRINWK